MKCIVCKVACSLYHINFNLSPAPSDRINAYWKCDYFDRMNRMSAAAVYTHVFNTYDNSRQNDENRSGDLHGKKCDACMFVALAECKMHTNHELFICTYVNVVRAGAPLKFEECLAILTIEIGKSVHQMRLEDG